MIGWLIVFMVFWLWISLLVHLFLTNSFTSAVFFWPLWLGRAIYRKLLRTFNSVNITNAWEEFKRG